MGSPKMKYEDEYEEFRRKPLKKKKMSVRKLRKGIKKAEWIGDVGNVLEIFLCQFSKLELRWINVEIMCTMTDKYDVGAFRFD